MSAAPDQPVYRPVSGLAIAGLGLAGVCALVVVTTGVQALATGVPLLLDAGWLAVPALAAGLSLAARLQIQRSEGTLAGLPLARWGLYLSVLTGVCYLAFRVPKEIAVRQEAADITDRWFDHLRKSESDPLEAAIAFWGTTPLDAREPEYDLGNLDLQKQLRDSPKDLAHIQRQFELRYFWGSAGQPGRLPAFADHEIVKLVQRSGSQAEAHSRGVRSWEYLGKPRIYLVEQNYRLVVPEGRFDVVLRALGGPGKSGPERQWQIVLPEPEIAIESGELSPLGQLAAALSRDSRRFAEKWLGKLFEGNIEESFLETLPLDERARLADRIRGQWLGLLAVPPSGELAPLLAAVALVDRRSLPGFSLFEAGAAIDARKLKAPEALRAEVENQVRQLFRGSKATFSVPDSQSMLASPWQIVEVAGRREVQFRHSFRLWLPDRLVSEGVAVIASADLDLLARLDQARQAGTTTTSPPGEEYHAGWRLVALELLIGGQLR